MTRSQTQQTISDFGEQWVRFQDNSGYYGSTGLFEDIVAPLLRPDEIPGLNVAEIGSGSGRIVEMLLASGAREITAIEPSRAFEVLARRFAGQSGRVHCHRLPGEGIADLGPFDLVLAIGVLHHIPNPHPVVAAAYEALRPGGRFLAWLYGREGNRLYLAVTEPLRSLTTRLPDRRLERLVQLLDLPLAAYIRLCRWLPLPLHAYMRQVLGRMAPDKRRLIIFDQLNPCYAKYYTAAEAEALLASAGFSDIALHHRHGYSWTLIGRKPAE